jgi:hypothetical protein
MRYMRTPNRLRLHRLHRIPTHADELDYEKENYFEERARDLEKLNN